MEHRGQRASPEGERGPNLSLAEMSRNAYKLGYAVDGVTVTRTFHLGSKNMTDETTTNASRPCVAALCQILGEVADVAKDATLRAKYTHDYRSKEAIFDVFRRRLAESQIFPRVAMIGHTQVEQKQGKGVALFTVSEFEIEFIHGPSGDSVRSTWFGEAADTNDKGTNKTMTAALRTYFENQFMLSEFAEAEVDYEYQKAGAAGPVHDVPKHDVPEASIDDLIDLFLDHGYGEEDAFIYGDYIAENEGVSDPEAIPADRLAVWIDGLAKLSGRKFRDAVDAKLAADTGKGDDGDAY